MNIEGDKKESLRSVAGESGAINIIAYPKQLKALRNAAVIKDYRSNELYVLAYDHHKLVLFKLDGLRLMFLRSFDIFNQIAYVRIIYDNLMTYVVVICSDHNTVVFSIDFDNFVLNTISMINLKLSLNLLPALDYHKHSTMHFELLNENYHPVAFAVVENHDTLYLFSKRESKALEWLFKRNIKGVPKNGLVEFISNVHQETKFVSEYSIRVNLKRIVKHHIVDLSVGLRNGEIVVSLLYRKPVATLVANNSKIEAYQDVFTSFALNVQTFGYLIAEKEDLVKIDPILKSHSKLIEYIKPDVQHFLAVDQQRNIYAFDCRGYFCLIDENLFTVVVYDEIVFNRISLVVSPANLLHVKLYGTGHSSFVFTRKNNKIFIENQVSTLILSQINNNWCISNLIPLVPIKDIDFDAEKIIYEVNGELVVDAFTYTEKNYLPQPNLISCFYFLDVTQSLYFTDNPNSLISLYEDKSKVTKFYSKRIEFENKLPLTLVEKTDAPVGIARVWTIPGASSVIILSEEKSLGIYGVVGSRLELLSELQIEKLDDELMVFTNFPDANKFTVIQGNKLTVRSVANGDLLLETTILNIVLNFAAVGNTLYGITPSKTMIKVAINYNMEVIESDEDINLAAYTKLVEHNRQVFLLTPENHLHVYDSNLTLVKNFNFSTLFHTIQAGSNKKTANYSLTDPSMHIKKIDTLHNFNITDFSVCSLMGETFFIFILDDGKLVIYKNIDDKALFVPHSYVQITHSKRKFTFDVLPMDDFLLINIHSERTLLFRKKHNFDVLEDFNSFPAMRSVKAGDLVFMISRTTFRAYKKLARYSISEFKETTRGVIKSKIDGKAHFIVHKIATDDNSIHILSESGQLITKIHQNKNEHINFAKTLDKNAKGERIILFLGILCYLPNSTDFIAKWRIYTLQYSGDKLEVKISVEQSFQDQNQKINEVADFDETILIFLDKKIIQIELNKITKVIETELESVKAMATSGKHIIVADLIGYINFYYFDDTAKNLQLKGSFFLPSPVKYMKFIEDSSGADSDLFLLSTEANQVEIYKLYSKTMIGNQITLFEKVYHLDVASTVRALSNQSPYPELLIGDYSMLRFTKIETDIFEALKSVYKFMTNNFPFVGGFSPLHMAYKKRIDASKSTTYAVLDYRVFEMYVSLHESVLQYIYGETEYSYSKICNRLAAIKNKKETN